jgi:hypothetical protein
MITNDANTLVFNAVVSATFGEIDIISLRNSGGEFFRKTVTAITSINSTKRVFTFFMSELEGNDDIVEIAIHGNGATATLNSGTTYATSSLVLEKTAAQSLTIDWSVELK